MAHIHTSKFTDKEHIVLCAESRLQGLLQSNTYIHAGFSSYKVIPALPRTQLPQPWKQMMAAPMLELSSGNNLGGEVSLLTQTNIMLHNITQTKGQLL